jgi:hypothetical protein
VKKNKDEPQWKLGSDVMQNLELEILGVTYNCKCIGTTQICNRVQTCYRSLYSLRDFGLSYADLNSEVKSYLWNTMCQPVL